MSEQRARHDRSSQHEQQIPSAAERPIKKSQDHEHRKCELKQCPVHIGIPEEVAVRALYRPKRKYRVPQKRLVKMRDVLRILERSPCSPPADVLGRFRSPDGETRDR